jgi:putative pyruvate formate lyase activating enzyme
LQPATCNNDHSEAAVVKDFSTLLEKCELCPRRCRAERLKGKKGYCGLADEIVIAHYGPHFGEEPPISGTKGSGNIFFSSCNLKCLFCQNHQISQGGLGKSLPTDGLVDIFFELAEDGCHNVNLVSPTSYVPHIATAIKKAKGKGLQIPFVYNTNAYETVETLRALDGLIDIYLPDFKYWSPEIARRLSDVPAEKSYPDHAKAAILEMKRQVGDLNVEDGLAIKGMIVRHLVLPGNVAGSRQIIGWMKDNLGVGAFISLMSQYFPLHKAGAYSMINRKIREDEYERLIRLLVDEGFENVFIQELESAPLYVPDFEKVKPFQQRAEGRGQRAEGRAWGKSPACRALRVTHHGFKRR